MKLHLLIPILLLLLFSSCEALDENRRMQDAINGDMEILQGAWRVSTLSVVYGNGEGYIDSSLYVMNDLLITGDQLFFKNMEMDFLITERFSMTITGDRRDDEAHYRVRSHGKIMLCSSFDWDRINYPDGYICYWLNRL